MASQTRMTKQRMIILEELRKMHSHPTADILYEIVHRRMPHISLGTVYRNLEFLVSTGAIAKLETEYVRRFDGKIEPHAHVRCIHCGALCDVPLPVLSPNEKTLQVEGFTLLSARVEYEGICENCAEKMNQEESQK